MLHPHGANTNACAQNGAHTPPDAKNTPEKKNSFLGGVAILPDAACPSLPTRQTIFYIALLSRSKLAFIKGGEHVLTLQANSLLPIQNVNLGNSATIFCVSTLTWMMESKRSRM